MLKLIIISFSLIIFSSCGSALNDSKNSKDNVKLTLKRVSDSSTVSIFSNIALEFSEELNDSTVTSSNIFLVDNNDTLVGSSIKADTTNKSKIILTPYKYFKPLKVYNLVVKKNGVKDLKGRMLSENYYYRFITTNDKSINGNFNISLIKPRDNGVNVDPHSDISLEFNRFVALDEESNIKNLLELRDSGNKVVSGTTNIVNSIISFTPSQNLEYATSYSLELKKSLSDMYSNIYDISKNKNRWNFRTSNKVDSYNKEGFVELNTSVLPFNKEYLIQTIKNEPLKSIVVLATQDSLKLYQVKYAELPQKPTLVFINSFPISFQVNAMSSFNDNYLIVGSAKNGVYTYKIDTNSITELSNIKFNEYVYGVSIFGNRAYSVGPKDGLRVYELENGKITLLNHVRSYDSVMLDVIAKENKIFVADYNGAVLIYDNNLSMSKKVSIAGSIKRLLSDTNSNEIFVFNSVGRITKIDTDGNLIEEASIDLPISIKDVDTLVNSDGSIANFLISDFKRYVVIMDKNLQNPSILDNNATTSVSAISAYNSNINFIVLASSEGKLSIKNLSADVLGAMIENSNVGDNLLSPDGFISFDIKDEHLDSKQIVKDNFIFKESTTGTLIDYNISLTAKDYNIIRCTITPKKILTQDSSYLFIIKNSLKDMIGNSLQNGDYSINFKVQDVKLTLSGADSVNEGSNAKYTISVDRATKVDLSVNIKLTLLDANASDIVSPSTTYIIPAGSKSITFDIATTNNTYENKNKKYSVSLVKIASGGGFSKIDADTTAVVTTIVNDDIARVSSITTSSSGTEGSSIIYSVVLSNIAKYDKTYSYVMPYLKSIDTASYNVDYTESVSSNVTIDKNSKTITVPAGTSNFNFIISTIDDSTIESSETFSFMIDNRSGKGTIVDNDYAAVITQPPPQSQSEFVQ